MKLNGDAARRELSMQLATGFAAACLDYLPVMEEGVRRTSQRIGFTANVSIWRNKDGVIQGRLSTTPPKIPTKARAKVDFILEMNSDGQLGLTFEGTPKERKRIEGG